jgi:hypothetical protein
MGVATPRSIGTSAFAGFRGDDDAAARLLGESYVWIDHCQDVIARTIEDLLRIAKEHSGWIDLVADDRIGHLSASRFRSVVE